MRKTSKESVTTEVLKSVICDMCKKEFTPREWDTRPCDGCNVNSYNILISYYMSHNCPYGDMYRSKEFVIDICVECWEAEFIPWLQSKGVDTTYKESEW